MHFNLTAFRYSRRVTSTVSFISLFDFLDFDQVDLRYLAVVFSNGCFALIPNPNKIDPYGLLK